MIIANSSSTSTDSKALNADQVVNADAFPPSYASVVQQTTNVKPSNFVSITQQNNSVKGAFVIDPSLKAPPSWLPILPDGETGADRQNLLLESKNGSVQADISVLSTELLDEGHRKVTLTAKSTNGSVVCKVHRRAGLCPRLALIASSKNGSVTVHIPRSFSGSIICRGGRAKMSAPLMTQTTTFGNVGDTSRYYVGDYDPAHVEENIGDQLVMESKNGSLKIFYDDEEEPSLFSFLFRSARQILSG
ncbi:hypothetical protein VKT23_014896 [Stygiomarasmius scandens]|uniref:DUF7330 domain-containing protein n=1 Tax=Marasmiellus scandens TaxID=2682957 RepID=A0ABR1J419_9AGAR